MNKAFVLDTMDMSNLFFEKSTLWGINSPMMGYDLCHVLNVSFRLNLVRRVDFDLAYTFTSKKKSSAPSLFDEEPLSKHVYFPVYHQSMELSDTEIYVYSNKHNGNVLIPSQKNLDYFILVKNALYMDNLLELDKYITRLRKIDTCVKINLSTEKWIENLIL